MKRSVAPRPARRRLQQPRRPRAPGWSWCRRRRFAVPRPWRRAIAAAVSAEISPSSGSMRWSSTRVAARGRKVPTPHVQGEEMDPAAASREAREQLLGEMQSGGRRGHRASIPARRRSGTARDRRARAWCVGRCTGQGGQPVAIEKLGHGPRRLHRHLPHAVLLLRDDAHGRLPRPHAHPRAHPASAARARQRIPPLVPHGVQHEQLHRMSARLEVAEEPGGNHAALVGDEAIALSQERRQVAERPVDPCPSPAIHHEEARGVAWLGGFLRDQLGRQFIVEQPDIHDPRSPARDPSRGPPAAAALSRSSDPGGASKSGRSKMTCPASS